MLAQRAKLPASEGMRGGRTVLDPSDVDGCAVEVDLLPTKINDPSGAEAMPERQEDHERIPVAPTIALRSLDQIRPRSGLDALGCVAQSWAVVGALFDFQWSAQ
jgi:hypothetical protein